MTDPLLPKTTVTAYTVIRASDTNRPVKVFRDELLAYGVLKGTVSKMEAVLKALNAGTIQAEQVTSLNSAYELVVGLRLTYRIERTNPSGTWVDDYVNVTDFDEAVAFYQEVVGHYLASDVRIWRGKALLNEHRSDMGKSAWRKK